MAAIQPDSLQRAGSIEFKSEFVFFTRLLIPIHIRTGENDILALVLATGVADTGGKPVDKIIE